MSQKRVAIVLASLVATMTLSAAALLLMENGPLGASPFQAAAIDRVPVRALLKPTVPLQTRAWHYIIVYESGDLAGSAATLADGRTKGVGVNATVPTRQTANFHFVVDNASSRSGALDGEVEVGSSWLRQEIGTPHRGWPDPRYHLNPAYTNAIGICLVGKVNEKPYTDGQYRSLVQLLRGLQEDLPISREQIRFQWELEPQAAFMNQSQKDFAEAVRQALD